VTAFFLPSLGLEVSPASALRNGWDCGRGGEERKGKAKACTRIVLRTWRAGAVKPLTRRASGAGTGSRPAGRRGRDASPRGTAECSGLVSWTDLGDDLRLTSSGPVRLFSINMN
jgi:hypothetical protein